MKWISVKERLPEDMQEVVAYFPEAEYGSYLCIFLDWGEKAGNSRFRWESREFSSESEDDFSMEYEMPLYWLPLPKIPK